ncbi:TIGR04255 family protein [Desulfuromusa kysingii]|uniref:TIGR04255 family protein n=1 Tax=Desulfuromusa kysingii TaxID=37625 RepID=A0A1H4AH34_9BACT|nr:TIGR04255 family protein [Desulfuromusa kysingii]SEA35309.1 TIGR04255 family protein [Desulfuromusa kysingii]
MQNDFVDYKYKKNYLTNVIFKLDFSALDHEEFVDEFSKGIKDSFPVVEKKVLKELKTEFKEGNAVSSESAANHYNFFDSNKERKVSLFKNYLAVELYKYKDMADFSAAVAYTFKMFSKLYDNADYRRLGVRYINQIILEKGNPFAWKDYISSYLTSISDNFFVRDSSLSRSMSQVTLNKEDYKITFSFGMYNSEFPAKISRKEFVLDYDCYTEFVELDSVCNTLDKFNHEIKSLFEKSINNGLRKNMGVITDEVL